MTEPDIGLEGQTSGEGGIRVADAAVADEQVGLDIGSTDPAPLDTLAALDRDTATALVAMTRAMYPHDRLPDVHYARVVAALDAKAAADEKTKVLLTEGVGWLATTSGRWPREFGSLPEPEQVAALTRLQHTPFFKAVAGEVVVNLYSQHDVWPYFGYEGPAPEGYLDDFDDIDWLDDAPDLRDSAVEVTADSARGKVEDTVGHAATTGKDGR